MPSKPLFFLVLLSLTVGLSGLELQRGKLKVVINERTGRFSLYGSEDQNKPVWTPLFSAEDPTTSKWKLLVGDKVAVLGDDPTFSTAVEATLTGAKVVWTSKALVATLTFDFLLSSSSSLADGLRLLLSIANVSEAPVKVGVRWVLDSNLGEKKDHFRLSTGELVAGETRLEGNLPDWWISPSATDEQLGLVVMLGKGASVPSRIVFANWKRLEDANWDYSYRQGRDFNQLPYSFNDSAVAQYYDPQDIAPGKTRELSFVLGLKSARSFEGARLGSANPLDDFLKKNQDPTLGALDQDLVSLQTLLAQIDAKLADPSRVTAEDLKLLQAVLNEMDVKRKNLEATKP